MHCIILGIGGMGKSTVAFKLAQQHVDRGEGVLILDPNNDPGWPAGANVRKLTGDGAPLRFLALAKRSIRCALFIDEAGESIGRGKHAAELKWLTTRCRHWGHRSYIIGQRAQLVEPTVRSQCTTGYVFRQSVMDAKILANDFADDALLRASSLGVGEFLFVQTGRPVRLLKLAL